MSGGKASALAVACARRRQQFTRFDYQGHGASSGRFEDGTIGLWRADALAVLDQVTTGPQIVVGSSMGGWIASLLAADRPDRVAGLVLIAPALDFTEALIRPRLSDAARRALETAGVWYEPSDYDPAGYPITRNLLDEGRRNLLLPGPIPYDGPVHILQGMRDAAVPWQHALRVADAFRSRAVVLTLIKDGEHRLSEPNDIRRLIAAVDALSQRPAASSPASPSR